ncbi:hypothetical protein AIOL_004687 [Candidatus Rhodobacter oscarellae]|uniref:Uncharacterized protein n=1 Tax=Candidatus Rhodobacter oscarellae TaxID=1675527 RepID=A0A0J9EDA2_9RHOB|nr:hypothetical protein AIOL_004687 [Candidatus Rhodobacter lobularis]
MPLDFAQAPHLREDVRRGRRRHHPVSQHGEHHKQHGKDAQPDRPAQQEPDWPDAWLWLRFCFLRHGQRQNTRRRLASSHHGAPF